MFENWKKRKAAKLLRKADEVLEGRWTRQTMSRFDPDIDNYRFCAAGAIVHADTGKVGRDLNDWDYSPTIQLALDTLATTTNDTLSCLSVTYHNDYRVKTEYEVHAWFNRAIAKLEGK